MSSARRVALLALAAGTFSGCALQRQHLRRALQFAHYRLESPGPSLQCGRRGELSYCRYRPRGMEEDPDTTLYFLHYASGDERSFAHVGLANAFYHAYRAAHKKPPKIVALSYGTHWLLSNQPGRRQVVSTRAVLSEAVPFLEERFGAPKRRLLWGMSQGAYNALELALAAPDRWAAVAASCPALYAVDPFGGKAEAVAREERAPLGSVRDGMALFNSRLAGSSVWRAEEPIGRVEAGGRMPPLLLQPNTLDEFGFAAGSEALSRALINRHETVTLSPQRGGHCVFDAAQVAGFFSGR